jgi:hypothetical protein
LCPIRDIVSREQNLCYWLSHMGEKLIPERHEAALAYCCESLYFRKVLWTLFHVHSAQADADGAGGDKDYFVALGLEFDCCFDYDAEDGEERFVGAFVDYGTCS